MMNTGKLAGRTIFITGASRGIGKEIALKAARDGANIIIAAKTATAHPKLPGTIYTAAEEVEKAGGKAHPCIVDVRDEAQVHKAVQEAVAKFGGIDILINNASAISLTSTLHTDMKRYDLMHNINTRGTFLVTKECLPYILKSDHGHVLNISPPLNMSEKWFAPHVAYTMAKYGMSMCVLGMAQEFADQGVAFNSLWPRTAIYTAALQMLQGDDSFNYSRKPDIMADAAYTVLCKEPRQLTGQFLVDEKVLREAGITDFVQYACNPEFADQLADDFFLEEKDMAGTDRTSGQAVGHFKTDEMAAPGGDASKVPLVFTKIEAMLSPDIVMRTQAVYQFNILGETEKGTWYLDLKNGSGSCGQGTPNATPDATLSMSAKNFFDMFAGQLKPAPAYMSGKLKVSGDLTKALKLEKLMKALKSKL